MVILIDNYDSFTWNLVHYLGEIGAETVVHRNDKVSVGQVLSARPQAIVLSPGPCTPNEAGICLELIAEASSTIPVLGVCLGHQAIGQAFGGKVVRAPKVMHGKMSAIDHDGEGMFRDVPDHFQATRYHSLIVERETLPRLPEDHRGDRRHRHGRSSTGSGRCTGCSSIPKASPPSTATRSCTTSSPSPGAV